jgi:hypothetical protein
LFIKASPSCLLLPPSKSKAQFRRLSESGLTWSLCRAEEAEDTGPAPPSLSPAGSLQNPCPKAFATRRCFQAPRATRSSPTSITCLLCLLPLDLPTSFPPWAPAPLPCLAQDGYCVTGYCDPQTITCRLPPGTPSQRTQSACLGAWSQPCAHPGGRTARSLQCAPAPFILTPTEPQGNTEAQAGSLPTQGSILQSTQAGLNPGGGLVM